jgi:hypothetical protein
MLNKLLLKPKPSAYSSAIAEATGAHPMELPIIENIMRDIIFHSTLDWQTKEEFDAGAREAYEEYQSRSSFYNAQYRVSLLRFQLTKAEEKLAEAVAKLDRAIARGRTDRITHWEAVVEKLRKKRDGLADHHALWKRVLAQFIRLNA